MTNNIHVLLALWTMRQASRVENIVQRSESDIITNSCTVSTNIATFQRLEKGIRRKDMPYKCHKCCIGLTKSVDLEIFIMFIKIMHLYIQKKAIHRTSVVCPCVGHNRQLCKNGWTDPDAVWGSRLTWAQGTKCQIECTLAPPGDWRIRRNDLCGYDASYRCHYCSKLSILFLNYLWFIQRWRRVS